MAILLLTLSFFYIDRQGRQTFLYAIYHDDVLTGYEKVDRYLIENKLIYKSLSEYPRSSSSIKKIQKIRFGANGKELIDYNEEIAEHSAKSVVYIKNLGGPILFLGIANADFTYIDEMAVRGNFTIFNKESIAAYAPLVRRYNFKKRGEQFFNTLNVLSPELPPMPSVVSITAIGKDIITINNKRVKCENLIFELENKDLISVWITSAFHNTLMVRMPKYGFKAVLSANREPIPVEEYTKKSDLYTEKELVFKSGDISLNGILSMPAGKKKPCPALLLIWDKGPSDKNAFGIFADIAGLLARNGYGVFRFDKRGVGKSQGFFSTYDQAEEIVDLKNAIQFLKSLPEIDKDMVGVLGYGEGAFYAAYLTGTDSSIRWCILLAASIITDTSKDNAKKITWVRRSMGDNTKYIEDVIKALLRTKEIAMKEGDWMTIEGNSVFTRKAKMSNNYNMREALKGIQTPVLIAHGKNDALNLPEEAKEIEAELLKNGNNSVTLIYLDDLDHTLGRTIKAKYVREHIEVDPAVTKNILSWLDRNLIPPEVVSVKSVETAVNAAVE